MLSLTFSNIQFTMLQFWMFILNMAKCFGVHTCSTEALDCWEDVFRYSASDFQFRESQLTCTANCANGNHSQQKLCKSLSSFLP